MAQTVGQAFKISLAEMKKNSDPFRVKDSDKKHREKAPGNLHQRQLHRADLTAVKPIGAGQYGQVWLADQKTSIDGAKRKVAVKLMRGGASAADKDDFIRESEMTLMLNHPNLVALIAVAVQQKPWLCVLEFLPYGDAKGVVMGLFEKGIKVTEYEKLHLSHQIADGMAYAPPSPSPSPQQ